jgi:thioredoxin reductase (NADPH)
VLLGRGIYYGSASTEASACEGEHVVIVGGANSAGQAAVFFSTHAAKVSLVVRGDSLERSMSSYLVDQVRSRDNIEVRTCTVVEDCQGEDHLRCVTLYDRGTGEREVVDVGHLFVFIGAAPLTDWLDGEVARDRAGFVVTGPELVVEGRRPDGWDLDRDPYLLESSLPGVFVAGDVRSASVKRVASAVGEGALAVTLVHRYLAEQ